ncbi:MAG: ATP-grasp domain-containing protein, partial [Firmicutes bacterium]|nr:ATP-grasp domain-containing protein [Bacillota bacterium]
APHFIETGHLQPAPVDEKTMEHIKKTVEHALDSLGIEYGASHSEIKIDDEGNIKIIEIGGRMGGDCIGSDLVYYSAGYDFVKMVIDIACGKAPDFSRHSDTFPVESVFIFDNDDIAEFEKIKAEEPDRIIKVLFYAPENIGYTTDSSNRAGCYIRKYKKQE